MRNLLAIAVICAAALSAQVKLYVFTDVAAGVEREVTGATFDLGSTPPGDTILMHFRMRNTGTTPQQVQSIRVAGQGFTVSVPSMPQTISPNGTPLDFVMRFSANGSGTYSANLTAGSISVLVMATVLAGPSLVTLASDGSKTDVSSGTPVSFGSVQKGQKTFRTFSIENRNTVSVTIRGLQVTGPAFSIREPSPALPIDLAPGSARTFEVEFLPATSQQLSGSLIVDSRSYSLTGTGFDPPLPKPALTIEGTAASGQQPKLSIRLDSPAPANVSGTLRMDFTPVSGLRDDSAIRFVTSSAGLPRNVGVQAREGESQLFFGTSQRESVFQTGTTAGEITFTLEIGAHKETLSIRIPPAAPAIDGGVASRRVQDLDVAITGFDNTRSVTQALFNFFDASGRSLTPSPIAADVRREFEQFFGPSNATGGVFTMRASFPVQGPIAQIAGVEVEVVNGSGATKTQRFAFQQAP